MFVLTCTRECGVFYPDVLEDQGGTSQLPYPSKVVFAFKCIGVFCPGVLRIIHVIRVLTNDQNMSQRISL
jgi:hypothetical protein